MGVKTKQRTYLGAPDVYDVSPSKQRPEPIIDLDTDEESVILRLGNLATTGDFGYDDSREWGELFPTMKTLVGALHLLPETLEDKSDEERERLAELFDAKFEEQFSEHDRNLFARVIEPNQGMSRAYELFLEARSLKAQSDALHRQTQELVEERGIAYRATDEWNERFREAEKLNDGKRERLVKLYHNPDFSPTANKMLSAWRDFDGASSRLRGNVLGHIERDVSYDRMRGFAEDWLSSFEELKRRVREPNPKRKDDTPLEDTQEDTYED
jgi:hypothetical protein